MTTEEFQKIVLQKFDLLESEISATKLQIQENNSQIRTVQSQLQAANTQIKDVKSQITDSNTQIQEIKSQISDSNTQIQEIKLQISDSNAQIQEIKSQISNSNSQITEQTDMLKAILHNQEFVNAKIEGLTLTTAKIESVQQLQQEVNVLGRKIYAVSK